MAVGVSLTDKQKEQIIALKATGMSGAAIARQLKVSEASVSRTCKAYKETKPDEFESLRTENRKKIVDEVWRGVEGLTKLLNRRVNTLLEHEDKLEKCIIAIGSDDEIPDSSKRSVIRGLTEILSPKLVEITTALGTAWDKVEKSQIEMETGEASGVVILPEVKPLEPPKEDEDETSEDDLSKQDA